MNVRKASGIATKILVHIGWRKSRIERAVSIRATTSVRRIAPKPALTFPLGEFGRLGNQLFQIAGTIGIAASMDVHALFLGSWEYQNYFSLPDRFFAGRVNIARCREAWPLALRVEERARPYLQDLSLWEACRESIREWLQPSEFAREEAIRKCSEIVELRDKTSIHVRRGDYLTNPVMRLCPSSFYAQAVELVRAEDPSTEFLVFSDDIDWCRGNLDIPGAHYVVGNPDWLDMTLMSLCDHHICANSTFSWWGAFLSNDSSPIVPWITDMRWPHKFRQPSGWREIAVTSENHSLAVRDSSPWFREGSPRPAI